MMVVSKTIGSRVFDAVNAILLTILAAAFIYPLWHVLCGSLSVPYNLFIHRGVIIWPLGYSMRGYQHVLANVNLLTGYRNTIFIVVAGTACNLLMTILGAYVLSRRELMLKKLYTLTVVFTMYFGGGLIPSYLVVKGVGLLDSTWALILPGVIGTWNMIIMRTAFMAIPPSFDESAKMDGANDITILFRIILPMAKATLAVMTLFYAVGHWNAWFGAAIYITDRSKYPLQLFLREILISASQNTQFGSLEQGEAMFLETSIRYGMIIISTVPILCIYPFMQKYFMKGVMMGSLKE